MRVLDEYPELTEEEVLDMEVNEWLDLLNENNGKNTVIAQLRTQYRNDVKAIREKYAGLFTLRAEIEELKGQLDDAIDTTEKDKIADRIKAKENEARTLRDEYKAELSALKLQFKKDVKAERKQSK
ncbi:MAG: hypothetical protein IJX02_06730 [Clostridia bacterium]|nr:hypothetical protein [Clostridia bacterium]